MKVESNRPLRPAATKRGERARDAGGPSFTDALAGADTPAPATSATPLAGAAGLFALQEVGDPLQRRREVGRRGNRLLDRLEEIRRGLLAGTISRAALAELRRELKQARAQALDPGLDEVLAEIELRAAVELAKLEAA
jgi:Class II flagellar assembly regulator